MSDDGGGGDTNDYSSNNDYNNDTADTHADNDYSGIGSTFSALESALDFTSAIESTQGEIDDRSNDVKEDNNDFSGIGSAISGIENAATLAHNMESIRSAFDDDSSTRLQVDDRYTPSGGGNYIRTNNYLYETPNTTYIPYNNRRFWNNSRWGRGSFRNSNDTTGIVIIIVVAVIVIVIFATIIGINNKRSLATYKPVKLEPLPQGVYNAAKINWTDVQNSLKRLESI